jgi:hypothetical protein
MGERQTLARRPAWYFAVFYAGATTSGGHTTGKPSLADVFVSYVHEDRAIAEKISRGLEGVGLSVWWDRHIPGGVDFTKEIDRIQVWSSSTTQRDRNNSSGFSTL